MATTAPSDAVLEPADTQARVLAAVKRHVFLAVMQHCITIQSEPLLLTRLSGGDAAATMRTLANSQGLTGILSLVLNQAGGRISDATGRKLGLLIGPAMNVLLGLVVYGKADSRPVVVACRILRMIFTTFSNTVMVQAALTDVRVGAAEFSSIAAYIGGAVVLTPFAESLLFKASGTNPALTYLGLSAIGAANLAVSYRDLPETLPPARRRQLAEFLSADGLRALLNPFGFARLYTDGSAALQRMVNITTLQMFLEGKNLSDLAQMWMFKELRWRPEGARNFIMSYGAMCIVAGLKLTPRLLAKTSARTFTTLTNTTNALGFFLRGAAAHPALWCLAVLPMLPGVNGASSNALKALVQRRATAEGFGAGEFAAYSNNLRALAGAAAPVLYGNAYAALKRRGYNPGMAFWLAGLIGAALPQLLLATTSDEELLADDAEEAPGRKQR